MCKWTTQRICKILFYPVHFPVHYVTPMHGQDARKKNTSTRQLCPFAFGDAKPGGYASLFRSDSSCKRNSQIRFPKEVPIAEKMCVCRIGWHTWRCKRGTTGHAPGAEKPFTKFSWMFWQTSGHTKALAAPMISTATACAACESAWPDKVAMCRSPGDAMAVLPSGAGTTKTESNTTRSKTQQKSRTAIQIHSFNSDSKWLNLWFYHRVAVLLRWLGCQEGALHRSASTLAVQHVPRW